METGSVVVFYILGMPVTSYITTMWAIMAVLIVLGVIVSNTLQKVPGRFQMLAEYALGGMLTFYSSIMGPKIGRRYFPLIMTLFLVILFSNWCGLLPGADLIPGFRSPTSTWSVTAALAIIAYLTSQAIGIREKGLRHYVAHFFQPYPFMFPLEVIQELVKPLSLSLRLFGNIYGGEAVAAVLAGLFAPLTPIPMQLLDVLFGFIQAMVFTVLISIYISQATEEVH
jgi:F-type H+-transporting ATPase subunit a